MKQIVTVAGIIYNEKGEILCTEREVGKYEYTSLKWEFPGEKLEIGENNIQALERELREELEIKVQIQDKFYQYRNDEKHLKEILTNGANKARVYASKKMEIVKEKVGLSI